MLFTLGRGLNVSQTKGSAVTNKTASMGLNNYSGSKRVLHGIDVSLCHFLRRGDGASEGLLSKLVQYWLELLWREHAK